MKEESTCQYEKNLVVLVADKNMEHGVRVLISSRWRAIGIPEISFDIYVHPHRDPGIVHGAHDFLRPMCSRYARALVMVDYRGSGQENKRPEALAEEIRQRLLTSGWNERAEVIVLVPELEAWVWGDSGKVAECLGWQGSAQRMRKWLKDQGQNFSSARKPRQPKEAVEALLEHVRRPRSSAIYGRLAEAVRLEGCQDESFTRFRDTLRRWFAGEPPREPAR